VYKCTVSTYNTVIAFYSEVHRNQSASYETVLESFKRNGVGLKGIISSPHTFKGTELQTLNMKLRYVVLQILYVLAFYNIALILHCCHNCIDRTIAMTSDASTNARKDVASDIASVPAIYKLFSLLFGQNDVVHCDVT